MAQDWRICFLLMLILHATMMSQQDLSRELPPQLQMTAEEVIAGKYLNALLDILQFQSTNMWTTDTANKIMAYFHTQNTVITYSSLQVSVKNYLESLLYQPKVLLSEFRLMSQQHFQTAMKYLFDSKQDHLELGSLVLDLAGIRDRIFQSPGGNRTLFLITLERCFQTLSSTECVDILSQVLRVSSMTYLQLRTIASLPKDLPEDAFRNLSTVFKDLYDRISASAQKALYEWMTQILQQSYNTSDSGNSTSWVSAENLWILGRYMVHLPLEEIRKINPSDMRLFISYDNATKQLDTVYDITPGLAQAFLERINASGFDMRNTSTLYRLGLLVCFYNELDQMDTGTARVLLHQMIKCNQLRGFQADIQEVGIRFILAGIASSLLSGNRMLEVPVPLGAMLKSQLLDIAMQNHTLNDSLGSLSDAVVGLTTCQLESLSPKAVHGAIPTLNQVSGWAKSQVMVLSSKYLMYEKDLQFHNISSIGALVTGISTESFHSMSPRELSQVLKGLLAQHGSDLSAAQQHGILRKMIVSTELSVMTDIQGALFKEVSLFDLWNEVGFNSSVLKEKELRPSQALFLYELLSKKASPSDLLRHSQLVKGVTCRQIESMNTILFLDVFSVFENNLHLLSPYQINCLAWKFWKVSNISMPLYLLSVLPVEFLDSVTGSLCLPFVVSLGKVDLDHLVINMQKKGAILQKVEECLNGSVVDEYDIDLLGSLVCHLPSALICSGLSAETMVTAFHQFRLCHQLSLEQKKEIKHQLTELHGSPRNWTVETVLESGAFIALLPRAELDALVEKFPDIVFQAASDATGPVPATEELLRAQFESVRNSSTFARAPNSNPDCAGVRVPSSDEILRLSEANAFWPVQELHCMDLDTFTQMVERLGAVIGFNASQLSVLKEKAKQVWGPLPTWKSYHIVSLGRIATVLNETEIGELDLSSVDTIAALSQQTGWDPVQALSILEGFLEDSGQLVDDLKSFDLAGLGALLCALNATEVAAINAIEFSLSLLKEFKKKAESLFGAATRWNRSILQEIGTIAAGLNKEELTALDKELMPYIQPAAIKHIPAEMFKALSPEQIANLGPENAAMVTYSQHRHLDELQLHSLQLALDGARTNTQDAPFSESTTGPTYTTPLNEACSSYGKVQNSLLKSYQNLDAGKSITARNLVILSKTWSPRDVSM